MISNEKYVIIINIVSRLCEEDILQGIRIFTYALRGTSFYYNTIEDNWFRYKEPNPISFLEMLDEIKDPEILNRIIFHLDDLKKLGV